MKFGMETDWGSVSGDRSGFNIQGDGMPAFQKKGSEQLSRATGRRSKPDSVLR